MIKKIIENAAVVISCLLLAWIIVSFFDMVLHNCSGGSDAAWNFWRLLLIIAE